MQKIFTTKISLQSSNPTFSYPIIRLPRDLKELAGQIVNIYDTEIDGVRGFFVAPRLANLAKLERSFESTQYYNQELCEALIDEKKAKKRAPESGFEPESEPRQGSMIGLYTIRTLGLLMLFCLIENKSSLRANLRCLPDI